MFATNFNIVIHIIKIYLIVISKELFCNSNKRILYFKIIIGFQINVLEQTCAWYREDYTQILPSEIEGFTNF